MAKKTQVTLFIIFAIVIIILFILFFSILTSQKTPQKLSEETSHSTTLSFFEAYVDSCAKKLLDDSLIIFGYSDLYLLENYLELNLLECLLRNSIIGAMVEIDEIDVLLDFYDGNQSINGSIFVNALIYSTELIEFSDKINISYPLINTLEIPLNGLIENNVFFNSVDNIVKLSLSQGVGIDTPNDEDMLSITIKDSFELDFSYSSSGPFLIGRKIYKFNPEGTTFSPYATLIINYDKDLIPSHVSEDELKISVYDEGEWRELDTVVDVYSSTLSANIQHFSEYAITHNNFKSTYLDFDGDGKADLALYLNLMFELSNWHISFSSQNEPAYLNQGGNRISLGIYDWGNEQKIPVPEDYDGDGLTDLAVYLPHLSAWHIYFSNVSYPGWPNYFNESDIKITPEGSRYFSFGQVNSAIPVPADYDGDGKADIAVFDPEDNYWHIFLSSTGQTYSMRFGNNDMIPVPADYDGDGKADIAMYHPDEGMWHILKSSTGEYYSLNFGNKDMIPVPADYEGDGKTNLAVYNTIDGEWNILLSDNSIRTILWGDKDSIPVPADYTGNGKANIAIFSPSVGAWLIEDDNDGYILRYFGDNRMRPPVRASKYISSSTIIYENAHEPLVVAEGSAPAVAIDSNGDLHLVYFSGRNVFYKKIKYPSGEVLIDQTLVGLGGTPRSNPPRIAVDSNNIPHIVFGSAQYVYLQGDQFSRPLSLMGQWKMQDIAIDSNDYVYVAALVRNPRSVSIVVLKDGQRVRGPVRVGGDDLGSLAIDGQNTVHLTWRDKALFYNTYNLNSGAGNSARLHLSSDYSWVAYDPNDETLHFVNTRRNGGAINYRFLSNDVFSEVATLAGGAGNVADNIGPKIAVDSNSCKYITYSRVGSAHYFILNQENKQMTPSTYIGTGGGSKGTNPHVASGLNVEGAIIAWGDGVIYVKGVNCIRY